MRRTRCSRRDVARLGLMLVVGLLAFRQQEPFVDVMVDEIPRQNFVVRVMARDEEIGISECAARRPRRPRA